MDAESLLQAAFQKCGIDAESFPQFKAWVEVLRKHLEVIRQLPHSPVAVEAFWDGDTQGWFAVLVAIVGELPTRKDYNLLAMRFGGDIRIFNNAVPPWPEAQVATALGNRLSQEWGIPFYFASPTEPDDDCPRWGETAVAACRNCGKPLMRLGDKGVCHPCWVKLKYWKSGEASEP